MIVESDFNPPYWLRNAHLQTVAANQMRLSPLVEVRRERLELPDGDFLDLDWAGGGRGPLILILHGLAGSIRSKYARGLMRQITARGWRALFMHFRGASEEPNRLPRSYHSGETADIEYVACTVHLREPQTPLAAVGYSLGGNVLLKWLGECGSDSPLRAAVAVSVPFDLATVAQRMQQRGARLYQQYLLRSMRASMAPKLPLADVATIRELRRLRTFPDFDNRLTAPLHGFRHANDYYRRASCRPYLTRIRVPTLIIHALDDPFMRPDVIPAADELSPMIRLELSRHGGHVGFIDAAPRPYFWLEKRIPAFLKQALALPDC